MPDRPDWDPGRYRPLLCLLAHQLRLDARVRRRFDSSDVAQEALTRACEELPEFRGTTEAEFVAWLQKILANRAIDMIRREGAARRDVALEQSIHNGLRDSSERLKQLADRTASPSEQAAGRELLVRVPEAIEQLPEDQREVVLLRDLQGLPVAEIAARLGRTEKSVAGFLRRGRRRLAEILDAYRMRGT
jgi:RNA polymerase sigma-70 factor (ECF subfamily)